MTDDIERELVDSLAKGVAGELKKRIVGQETLVEGLLIALYTSGHCLLEGVPGLGKTTAIKAFANALDLQFQRIQFTPDLLPGDITGTPVFDPRSGEFVVRKGPIFGNIILADEINRAPAKVQSALLQAMEERQVTIGEETFALESPFLVLATQNPIEQEGTYPLPEAQLDRFMLKISLEYPSKEDEFNIIEMNLNGTTASLCAVAGSEWISAEKAAVSDVYIDEKIKRYILDIVFATRFPREYTTKDGSAPLAPLEEMIVHGASPRASIYLAQAARVRAYLAGRLFVNIDDVKSVAPLILQHRLILSYASEIKGNTLVDIVQQILNTVEVP
jgi:MoxR-like ATPase